MKTTTTDIMERSTVPSGRVDKANGVIRGVKILGRESANGRKYTDQAIRKAAPMYEGKGVFIDHPARSTPNAERAIQDRIGWLENVTVKPDGLYGDLHILKSHPLADTVFESAETNPSLLGLSHNARAKTRRDNGIEVVEEIGSVRSVDLVTDPATTKGLFESMDTETNDDETEPMGASELLREFRGKLLALLDESGKERKMTIGQMFAEVHKLLDKYEPLYSELPGREEEEASESRRPFMERFSNPLSGTTRHVTESGNDKPESFASRFGHGTSGTSRQVSESSASKTRKRKSSFTDRFRK
jgi:hypothetical protein